MAATPPMDFSVETKPPIEFAVDGDTFYCAGACPGGVIGDLAAVVKASDDSDKLLAVMEFFDQVMMPESADLFANRLRDPERPITFAQSINIFEWLVEKYTEDSARPTQGLPSSPSGRSTTGKSSTGRVRSGVSTRKPPVSVVS